ADLTDWLDEFERPGFVWFVKRLAANDTLATNAHQAGPYIPKRFLFTVFPGLDTIVTKNPELWFDLYIDSNADHRNVRAIYYNTRPRGEGTRDEARITNFGGRQSALLDPDSTGALTVFSFNTGDAGVPTACHVWVCRHATEEDVIEERIGPVEPGEYTVWAPSIGREQAGPLHRTNCRLTAAEIPPEWLVKFPSGEDIIRRAVQLRTTTGMNPDERLLRRRDCEFEVFQSVEEAFYSPRIGRDSPALRASSASLSPFCRAANRGPGIPWNFTLARSFWRKGCGAWSTSNTNPSSKTASVRTSCSRPRRLTRIPPFQRYGCECWRQRQPASIGGGRSLTKPTGFARSTS